MSKTILTIDDSASIRQMVAMTLKSAGLTVLEAGNGLEGYNKATTETVHAVITDLNMPVMNGLEFLQRVQKEPAYQAIPVIIISTEGKEEDTIRGLKMGAKGYVKKPFQASELHGLIEKITAGAAS